MRINHTFKIVIACVGIFLAQLFFRSAQFSNEHGLGLIEANFALVQSDVLIKPWMFVSAMFLHGDVGHLIFNMISLAIFGSILEHVVGRRNFLIVFFSTGILANLLSAPYYEVALGASGAVLGILGALTMLRPHLTIYVYFFPMPLWVAAILYALIDVFGIFYPSGVGNIAHLVGLAGGLALGYKFKKRFGERRPSYEPININSAVMDDWEDKYMRR